MPEPTLPAHHHIAIAADPDPKDVRQLQDLVVQVTGLTGIWDIQLEGSIDEGTTWWPIETITANTVVHYVTAPELAVAWSSLRLRVATVGTGTPAGYVRGRIMT